MEQSNIQLPDTTKIAARADDLIASVGRAVINTPKDEDMGGDLLKMLKSIKSKAEDDRKTITGPINAGLKAINAKYKTITEPVDKAIRELSKKLVDYKKEIQRIAQEEERKAREEREAKALEDAAKLEAEGKTEAATELVEAAENASEKTQQDASKSSVRSEYGANTSMTDKWSAEVSDIRMLCKAVAEGKADIDCVLPNMPALNKLAKAMKNDLDIPGVTSVNNPVLTSR